MSNIRIVGIDTPWLDELIRLEEMPGDNMSARIMDISHQGGGKVSTALVAASRLGVASGVIGVLGDNKNGRFLLSDFQRNGVNTDGIIVKSDYECGFSVVISDDKSGGRRILWKYDHGSENLTISDIHAFKNIIENADYLHLCRMDEVDIAAAQIARSVGVTVCIDADFVTDSIQDNLNLIDIFIGSEEYYKGVFGEGDDYENRMKDISLMGPHTVIFTFGSHGCRGLDNGKYFECPAFKKNIVIRDTVGAGDVFHGAYLAGAARGMAAEKAAIFACAVSAIKCTRIGGRAGIPDYETVNNYIETGNIDYSKIDGWVEFYKDAYKQQT